MNKTLKQALALHKRDREIANKYRKGGISYAELGRAYGLTRERIRQICGKHH